MKVTLGLLFIGIGIFMFYAYWKERSKIRKEHEKRKVAMQRAKGTSEHIRGRSGSSRATTSTDHTSAMLHTQMLHSADESCSSHSTSSGSGNSSSSCGGGSSSDPGSSSSFD